MHKKLDIETVARDVVTFPALADRLNTIKKEDEKYTPKEPAMERCRERVPILFICKALIKQLGYEAVIVDARRYVIDARG